MPSEVSVPSPASFGTLLVVGSNPPTTSGQRTIARAQQACRALGFDRYELANLFTLPTYRTTGVSTAGVSPVGWEDARPSLVHGLDVASAVLLAYGVSKPAGEAGRHHHAQVRWLEHEISTRDLPVWWVGGAPRHPSRWHRHTHRVFPEMTFPDALRTALAVRATSG